MSPAHLVALWHAETIKLLSRTTARVGIVLLVLLAALPSVVTLVLKLAFGFTVGFDELFSAGLTVREYFSLSAPTAMITALWTSNFFVIQAFLVMLGAQTFASEWRNHTLREEILQPVHRGAVLMAKWLSLCTWVAATTVFVWLTSAGLGLVFHGTEGDWRTPILGFAASILANSGFAALVLLISVLTRSVPFTIAGVFLFVVLDFALLVVVKVAPSILPMIGPRGRQIANIARDADPWMPHAAFGVWMPLWGPQWQGYVVLGIITVLCLGLAWLAFRRMDVP